MGLTELVGSGGRWDGKSTFVLDKAADVGPTGGGQIGSIFNGEGKGLEERVWRGGKAVTKTNEEVGRREVGIGLIGFSKT